jgi:hypothetical protein
MSSTELSQLADVAQAHKIDVYQTGQGYWCSDTLSPYDPRKSAQQAFQLMVAMRAEMQYLEGKQEAVITSNDGKLSFSLPYGTCVRPLQRLSSAGLQ